MEMTSKELLRGIGALDSALVEEAETYQAPPARHWGRWVAVAACAAIVAAVSWKMLPRLTTKTAETPPPQPPVTVPSGDQGVGTVIPSDDADDAAAPEYAAGETLGGVALGMTQEEVEAVLGSDYDATEPREQSENYMDLCWYYPDINVRFVDEGAGWFVQELMIPADSSLTLSTGIGVDSTREEIIAAYPDATVAEEGGLWSASMRYADSGLWIFLDSEAGNYIRLATLPLETGNGDLLTNTSIGGLTLGLSQEMVENVLGTDYEASAVTELRANFKTVTWHYPGAELRFADTGDGWFLNHIRLSDDSTLTLSTGIGVHSTEAEVWAAYPDVQVAAAEDPYPESPASPFLYCGDVRGGLRFYVELNAVYAIELGPLTLEPEPLWQSLTAAEIVVHGADGSQVTLIDRAAKNVGTVLTISDPELAEKPGTAPNWWLDFGNGVYLAVYGQGDLATVYTGDHLDTTLETMTEERTGVYLDLDSTLESAMEHPTETWD